MKIEHIDDPIAIRALAAGDDKVVVTIGKPQVFDDEPDYYCPYSIELAGQKKLSYAGGVDAVQALQLTLRKIGVDLAALSKKKNVPITWLSNTPGETGFPT